jgi:23S rRNA (uracil1939-C5)-methyltransferase|uniref:23S rRNA (Uracil(1939)-C(5))-methyltransferase RlmD n=1 Tax=Desulfobacca acetoxidans TaxID=60893 RepID=A0A7V6A3J9_9BACT
MVSVKEPSSNPPVETGMELELAIEKLAFGGKALGRVEGFVVFVEHAVEGQQVRVRITRKKAHFAEARVVKVLEQSRAYVPPFCPHFGLCGGCQWQDMAYGEQLYWKQTHLEECLRHLAGLGAGVILPIVASPRQQYYRNKMEFTFAPRPWLSGGEAGKSAGRRGCALGLHLADSAEGIFDLTHCFLQSEQTPAIVREVRNWCRVSGLPPYHPQTRRGFWRFLVLREGKNTGQSLVQIITTDQGDGAAVAAMADHLRARFPEITTLVHSRRRKKAQVAAGEVSRTLWGPGYIEEHIGGLILRVSAHSFLQINTMAAERLYNAVSRLGEFTGRETVWDLYCGAGSLGLFLAHQVRRLVGFELDPQAVAEAFENSRLNNLTNCWFLAGDLKEQIQETMKTGAEPAPEVVITDPPRSGMHPRVVQAIKELAPRRLMYVSCNPATLARDLALLKDHYEVAAVQPFDLFPHTPHIEGVARLERRSGTKK